jgi:hypothetical protein
MSIDTEAEERYERQLRTLAAAIEWRERHTAIQSNNTPTTPLKEQTR